MKNTLLILLISNFCSLKAQKIYYFNLDSIEKQTIVFRENELLIKQFQSNFQEKDSLMVTKLQANANFLSKIVRESDPSPTYFEKKKNELDIEMKKIMAFEESIIKADSVLKLETRAWVRDFIKTKIRFYQKENNIKIAFIENMTHEGDKSELIKIISYINNSNWKTEFEHQFNFIKNKILFDCGLD